MRDEPHYVDRERMTTPDPPPTPQPRRIAIGRGDERFISPTRPQHRGIDDDHSDPPCGVAAVADGGEHPRRRPARCRRTRTASGRPPRTPRDRCAGALPLQPWSSSAAMRLVGATCHEQPHERRQSRGDALHRDDERQVLVPIAEHPTAARVGPRQRGHRQRQTRSPSGRRSPRRLPAARVRPRARRKKLNSTPRVSSSSGMTATTCWKNAGLTAPSHSVANGSESARPTASRRLRPPSRDRGHAPCRGRRSRRKRSRRYSKRTYRSRAEPRPGRAPSLSAPPTAAPAEQRQRIGVERHHHQDPHEDREADR